MMGNLIYYEIVKFDLFEKQIEKFTNYDQYEKQALDIESKANSAEDLKKIPAMHSQFSQDFTEENKLLKIDKL
jgi:hypothetical protein